MTENSQIYFQGNLCQEILCFAASNQSKQPETRAIYSVQTSLPILNGMMEKGWQQLLIEMNARHQWCYALKENHKLRIDLNLGLQESFREKVHFAKRIRRKSLITYSILLYIHFTPLPCQYCSRLQKKVSFFLQIMAFKSIHKIAKLDLSISIFCTGCFSIHSMCLLKAFRVIMLDSYQASKHSWKVKVLFVFSISFLIIKNISEKKLSYFVTRK